MSRALRPNARTARPTVWASAIQIPVATVTSQPSRISSGLAGGGGGGLRPPRPLPPRGLPEVRRYGEAPGLDEVVRVARVPLPAGLRLVPPERLPLPARERAAPAAAPPRALARAAVLRGSLLLGALLLGARVAMMLTVASRHLSAKDPLVPRVALVPGPACWQPR
jgi:hypothetical protein